MVLVNYVHKNPITTITVIVQCVQKTQLFLT